MKGSNFKCGSTRDVDDDEAFQSALDLQRLSTLQRRYMNHGMNEDREILSIVKKVPKDDPSMDMFALGIIEAGQLDDDMISPKDKKQPKEPLWKRRLMRLGKKPSKSSKKTFDEEASRQSATTDGSSESTQKGDTCIALSKDVSVKIVPSIPDTPTSSCSEKERKKWNCSQIQKEDSGIVEAPAKVFVDQRDSNSDNVTVDSSIGMSLESSKLYGDTEDNIFWTNPVKLPHVERSIDGLPSFTMSSIADDVFTLDPPTIYTYSTKSTYSTSLRTFEDDEESVGEGCIDVFAEDIKLISSFFTRCKGKELKSTKRRQLSSP